MDNLRGVNLPQPRFRLAQLSKELSRVNGFNSLQTFFPTLTKLYRINKHQTDDVWLDSKWRIVALDISGTHGPCNLSLVLNNDGPVAEERRHNAYLKVTHLLDPIRWMKGSYSLPRHTGLPWHNKTWATASAKLQDSWNQAYVESIASYALGRLRDEGLSPHFNEFYGAFCARADLYRYNLTDEFGSYRNARWFWTGQKKGLYKLCVLDNEDPSRPIDQKMKDDILREPSVMESDCDESDNSEAGEEEIYITDEILNETASLHSDEMSDISFAETSSKAESEMPLDEYKIYAELNDFPVMLIAVEQNDGTMDALLDDFKEIGANHGTYEWELRWSAWLFQVIAALSVAQTVLGFTHNDLHTNNVVWSSTKEDYLYYTLRSGATFMIPTFGKLFRIIDFGRAIFTINGTQFISDDFRPGNDADGQYCFKPLNPRPKVEVGPNPSFDLARLAVSLFESLFPDAPEDKEGGEILSSEEGLVMKETVSPLFNCIWSWMIDDDGKNILIEPDGSERFPDFDLYKHIAEKIHGAIPSKQFSHPAFDRFQVSPSEVANVKKWQLFC
jgi:hypothetical protein